MSQCPGLGLHVAGRGPELHDCQATGTGNRKSRIKNRNSPSADSKISWATTHHHPQLLEVKVWTDNKVPLVRMSQDDLLNPSSTKNDQVDSKNSNQGESNMIKEKVIKNPYLLGE